MNRNVFRVMRTNQFPIMPDEENGKWSKSRVLACLARFINITWSLEQVLTNIPDLALPHLLLLCYISYFSLHIFWLLFRVDFHDYFDDLHQITLESHHHIVCRRHHEISC